MVSLIILAASLTALQDSTTELRDSLNNETKDLEELVIVAKKEIIKSDGATLTYDMTQDDSTKGSSLLDALRKVPMITVDGQDKIRINGDSNFKIYVNGKEDTMLEANYDRLFKSMPANSVLKVEVITEPGAKYDAEGTGGILNLITEKMQRKDGYSGSLSAAASNREYSFSFLGRMKYRNFSADMNLAYGANSYSAEENDQEIESINYLSEMMHRQVQKQNQRLDYGFTSASLNTSWEPNDNNLFTFGGSLTFLDANIIEISSNTSMFSMNGEALWNFQQNIKGSLKMFSSSANASYQHTFGEKDHYIVASWLLNFGKNPFDLMSETNGNLNYNVENPFSYNYNTNYTRENTFQIDYTKSFAEGIHKLDTGIKTILRHNSANGYSGEGSSPSDILTIHDSKVDLTQLQDIYAVYASYTGNFGSVGATAGVRYEHTKFELKNNLQSSEDFRRHLNDVVPNAALTYLLSPASNLRLAYQMRISRPDIRQMNPYQMDILGTVVQEGNSDLKSEKSNNISLTYTNFGRIMGGNIFIDYKNVNNAISDYIYYTTGEDGTLITHSTTANIGSRNEIGLGGFYNLNITSKMNISINGRFAYVKLKSKSSSLHNQGWTGNYGCNWSYTGPADIRFSAYGGQSFNIINLQGHFSGWYYYGVGISKDILKESLNVSLNASNFLQNNIRYTSISCMDHQKTRTIMIKQSWRIGLNLTWNFGNLKSTTKKTNVKIENDDIHTSSSGAKSSIGI